MMAEAVLAQQMPTRTDEKPTGIFQRAATADQHAFGDLPPSVREVVRSGGQALDPGLRAGMESHFGRDFSQVRVHTDARAADSAHAISALAYTAGQHVVFGAGQYAPHSTAGRRLLAHELAHVVQQTEGRAAALDGLGGSPATRTALERDAAAVSASAADPVSRPNTALTIRSTAPHPVASPVRALQRQPAGNAAAPAAQQSFTFPLTYEGQPGREREITFSDKEFLDNYVDFNIISAAGLVIPPANIFEIDQNRVPKMEVTYRDGRKLQFNVSDIPRLRAKRPGVVSVGLLLRCEMRKDGFIYPVGQSGTVILYTPVNTPNLVTLRTWLYEQIQELQQLALLMNLTAFFANLIALSASVHSMIGDHIETPIKFGRIRRGTVTRGDGSDLVTDLPEPQLTKELETAQEPSTTGDTTRASDTGSPGNRRASVQQRARVAPGGERGAKVVQTGPWRGNPVIEDGNQNEGWIHIEGRHVTGNHPDGPGDQFAPGTTRPQLQRAAREVVGRGVRISNPDRRIQTFERRITINGQSDRVRVVVDTADGRVITMFPVRGGG